MQLSEAVFGKSEQFWLDLFANRAYVDVAISPWGSDDRRTVKYTMPRKGLQGKTAVESAETITVSRAEVIVVEIETKTPGVPYGTSFCTCTQYVFRERSGDGDGDNSTVVVTAAVKWLKSCSLKGTITKKIKDAMTKGLKETLGAIDAVWTSLAGFPH